MCRAPLSVHVCLIEQKKGKEEFACLHIVAFGSGPFKQKIFLPHKEKKD
jgi:hypothetical protein